MADTPSSTAEAKAGSVKNETIANSDSSARRGGQKASVTPKKEPEATARKVFAPEGAVIPPEENDHSSSPRAKTAKPGEKTSKPAARPQPSKPKPSAAKPVVETKREDAKPAAPADVPASPAPSFVSTKIPGALSFPEAVQQMWLMNPLHKVVPLNWKDLTESYLTIMGRATSEGDRTQEKIAQLNQRIWQDTVDSWTSWSAALLGKPAGIPDTDKLEKESDSRFDTPEWKKNPIFRQIAKAYQAHADFLISEAERKDLDPEESRHLSFHIRQMLDAMSPTLFLHTNPVAQKRAFETGGASLADGWRNFLADLKQGALSMTDVTAFKPGVNIACTPGKVVYRNRLIELIQYTPTTEKVHELPLLMMGPWISKYYVLDLQEKNSIVRYLLNHGITVFMISWRNPDEKMQAMTFEDYMIEGPVTASDVVRQITGSKKLNVSGYCIGGVLLATVLAALGAKKDDRFNSATFMVSMQDFTEPGDTRVFVNPTTIKGLEQTMTDTGYLDARWMSNMFSLLRANDLIWHTVVNNYLMGNKPAAFDLLYWNADNTRMAPVAHTYYLRNTYLENNLIKPGKLTLMGVPIDLKNITMDVYSASAEKDHIVPWISSWRITHLTGGKVRFTLSASGHVAGMINPPTKSKSGYWVSNETHPTPSEWQAKAEYHKGSWWPDWSAWLLTRSGKMVPPPSMGSEQYPPLMDAPGTYVLERS